MPGAPARYTRCQGPEDAVPKELNQVWVQLVGPQELAKDQPEGGYMMDNRPVRMTVAKKRGWSPGRPNKIQDRFLTHQPRNDERT